jgi:putative ABC transport system permease protein
MLRPRQPFDSRPLPVVASPDVVAAAGPGGMVDLDFEPGIVHARVVAEARRFPTTEDSGESFVVADEASLAAAIGASDLPASIPDELWLSTPPSASARVASLLGAQPYSSLAVSSRAAIAAGLRDEPLARGIVDLLLVAAAAALALALVGLGLVTAGFLRDERDLLFDLESQGIGPRALAACLRWRALALAAAGLAGGAALGAVMVLATERLLALDATLTLPDPPLQRVAPWLSIGLSAAAFALAAASMIELSLRLAHRHAEAGRGATGEGWEP